MGTAFLSDRLQMRGLFCVIFGSISVLGYGILLADVATSVHYFACFLVAGGLYVVVGLPLAWVRFILRLCTFFYWPSGFLLWCRVVYFTLVGVLLPNYVVEE